MLSFLWEYLFRYSGTQKTGLEENVSQYVVVWIQGERNIYSIDFIQTFKKPLSKVKIDTRDVVLNNFKYQPFFRPKISTFFQFGLNFLSCAVVHKNTVTSDLLI